ncbi:MAG: cytochrome o ubiquinol oxidase subunit IV [Candidatus Makana argininalis]
MNIKLNFFKKKKIYKKKYFIGFVLSLFFTILSFMIVSTNINSNKITIYILILFLNNILTHLFFFIKINKYKKNIWYIISFLFTILISMILIIGSCLIFNMICKNFIH